MVRRFRLVRIEYSVMITCISAFVRVAPITSQRQIFPFKTQIGPDGFGNNVFDIAIRNVKNLALAVRALRAESEEDFSFFVFLYANHFFVTTLATVEGYNSEKPSLSNSARNLASD